MTDIVNGLLLRDKQVLMAHRSPLRQSYPGTWSFPGGHLEADETIEQALTRELSEEIGIRAKSWSFIQRFDDQPDNPDKLVTFHIFVVDKWDGVPKNIGHEHTEIRWVKLVDAAQMQHLTFALYTKILEALAAA